MCLVRGPSLVGVETLCPRDFKPVLTSTWVKDRRTVFDLPTRRLLFNGLSRVGPTLVCNPTRVGLPLVNGPNGIGLPSVNSPTRT